MEVKSQLELGLVLGSWEVDPSLFEHLEDSQPDFELYACLHLLQFDCYQWHGNLNERAGPPCRVLGKML